MSIADFVQLTGAVLGWIYIIFYGIQTFMGDRATRNIESMLERQNNQINEFIRYFLRER